MLILVKKKVEIKKEYKIRDIVKTALIEGIRNITVSSSCSNTLYSLLPHISLNILHVHISCR
jgi:hypothetical protein